MRHAEAEYASHALALCVKLSQLFPRFEIEQHDGCPAVLLPNGYQMLPNGHMRGGSGDAPHARVQVFANRAHVHAFECTLLHTPASLLRDQDVAVGSQTDLPGGFEHGFPANITQVRAAGQREHGYGVVRHVAGGEQSAVTVQGDADVLRGGDTLGGEEREHTQVVSFDFAKDLCQTRTD